MRRAACAQMQLYHCAEKTGVVPRKLVKAKERNACKVWYFDMPSMQDAIFWSSGLVSRSTMSRQDPLPSALQSCPAHELSALTASLRIRSVCAVDRIAQELRAVNSVPRRQCEGGAGYCGKEHEDRPRPGASHEGMGDFLRGEGHEVRAPITDKIKLALGLAGD